MPQAMEIPDVEAADQEWKNSKQFQHGTLEKSRAKKRLFLKAKRDKKIHIAALMDISHFKNVENQNCRNTKAESCSRGHSER